MADEPASAEVVPGAAEDARPGRLLELTVTEVELLDSAGRFTELALMLGGESVEQGPDRGAAARAGAEQLLARAAAWRKGAAEVVGQPAGVA
jgi:hypothetical protein